jgi:hypothetical protein
MYRADSPRKLWALLTCHPPIQFHRSFQDSGEGHYRPRFANAIGIRARGMRTRMYMYMAGMFVGELSRLSQDPGSRRDRVAC